MSVVHLRSGLLARHKITDGAVYIEGKDGVVYAVDLGTGSLLWQGFDTGSSPTTGPNVSSPALVGKTVIVDPLTGCSHSKAVTGKKLRSALSGAAILHFPAGPGGKSGQVAFVLGYGDIRPQPDDRRATLWTVTTAEGFYASPVVVCGMLFDVDLAGTSHTYVFDVEAPSLAAHRRSERPQPHQLFGNRCLRVRGPPPASGFR